MTVMLYRAADKSNPQVWDWNVEHKVFTEADVDIALSEGWFRHPLDVPTPEEARGVKVISEPGGPWTVPEGAETADVELAAGEVVDFQPKRRGRPPKEG